MGNEQQVLLDPSLHPDWIMDTQTKTVGRQCIGVRQAVTLVTGYHTFSASADIDWASWNQSPQLLHSSKSRNTMVQKNTMPIMQNDSFYCVVLLQNTVLSCFYY